MIKIGIIPGYGVSLDNQPSKNEFNSQTPYGDTSSPIHEIVLGNKQVFVLSRHGLNNDIPSFMVNFKANIYALFELGCTHIISTSLCGSLQEEICTGEFVVFDQFIDLTTHKELSFTDKIPLEKLNHLAFNNPFADELRDCFIQSAVVNGITIHTKGTVVAIDGPRNCTRAESNLFRSWGADVVNTTTVPEAILAHELHMKYAAISLCTHFDTWRTDILPASRTEKKEVLSLNTDKFHTIIEQSINYLEEE